jgi:hypothetical protein
MAEYESEEFKFPDEIEAESKGKPEADIKLDAEEGKLEIEIEDDTPAEDKGREPLPKEVVKKLEVEVDELDQYSEDAKQKLKQMKKIWNDERRAKESAERERVAALEAAQKLFEENKRIKKMLESGEKEYKEAVKETAKAQVKAAKQAYKEAYEAGDAEKLMEAQGELVKAQLELDKAKKFKLPPLQAQENPVQIQQQYQAAPQPDQKVMAWQARNPWFGQDEEMTAAALGLHEKLKRQGVIIGSDEYYNALDKTMRKRFAENFDDIVEEEEPKAARPADKQAGKPSTVVAPATRSTASKKVKLKTSQVAIAKKLGLTPEQYVSELLKLEA